MLFRSRRISSVALPTAQSLEFVVDIVATLLDQRRRHAPHQRRIRAPRAARQIVRSTAAQVTNRRGAIGTRPLRRRRQGIGDCEADQRTVKSIAQTRERIECLGFTHAAGP